MSFLGISQSHFSKFMDLMTVVTATKTCTWHTQHMTSIFYWCAFIGLLDTFQYSFNPLNAKLNPICHLLALLGAHHILHVSWVRVNAPIRNV